MGRLWQTVILMDEYPLFEFLPFQTLITKNQLKYHSSLPASDKEGKSTRFIEYMLNMIDQTLDELLQSRGKKMNETERLEIFLESNDREFTRKDYLKHYSEISSATASTPTTTKPRICNRLSITTTKLYCIIWVKC